MFLQKKIIITTTFLSLFCTPILHSSLYETGRGTYGNPNVLSWGEGAKVRVGNFCSIAEGVTIMVGGDHRPDWVSTFPFTVLWGYNIPGHPRSKGDVIIGHDVWVAREAFILSGVTIGHGAVVGARAVVAKNVPPYAIVVGNPARIVKYRFEPEIIKQLLDIAWWDWSDAEIAEAVPYMMSEDIRGFINYAITK